MAASSSNAPPASPRPWPAKLAWRIIARATPPKRSADERRADFDEIYELFDEQSVRDQASRCIQCPKPLCRTGCPLANLIPEWLALAAEGKFLEAARLSQSTSNLPEICSRVCPQERLCEGTCILNSRSAPVAIGAVEKFINEYALAHGEVDVSVPPPNGFSVAVVGAGPGGLSCADELVKLGYSVTVFEALDLAGGLLLYGIPSFKLEKKIVARRVEILRRRGVQFQTGVRLGVDLSLTDLLRIFDAVFLGIGAQKSKPLDVPGADLKGVHQAIPFLVQTNLNLSNGPDSIAVAGRRVVVLGGGDTAMDCLRSALRSGASESVCYYRRDEANMPGSKKEFANAIEEGARFQFLTAPVAVEGDADGNVTAVRCIRMELGEPDASGRRKPRKLAGSEFVMPADVVLIAYGFDPVPFPPGSDLAQIAVNEWNGIMVDKSQMTSVPGVFAGGDLTRGPSLVVHAVKDARLAAAAIDRYVTKSGRRK